MNKKTKFIRAGKPPGGYQGSHRVAICVFALVFLFLPFTIFAANSGNTTGWGWAEKFGWLSFSGEGASVDYGVSVSADQITGHAWNEKTGWISFNCLNRLSCGSVSYGVANDGNGNLSGYAWSEKGGWINFEGAGAINYQVVVSQDGKFHGFAWSEKLGWINTNDVGSYYEPETDYAPARIYYSVGQNTTDHKTGSPTVTVSGLSATFSVPQTATNMGVGDVIDYDTDNKLCYIFAKVSEETWLCQTATGNAPTAATGATVNALRHAFASLSLAEAGASTLLGTSDLVTGNFQLNFPCYYDTGPDQTAVTIDGYTTGSTNYIRVYTPYDTDTEVNQSQRHQGKWDEGRYRLDVVATSNYTHIVRINEDFVRIDGLQIHLTNDDYGYNAGLFTEHLNAGSEIYYSNNVIRGTTNTTGDDTNHGIRVGDSDPTYYVFNNLIYGFNLMSSTRECGMILYGTAFIYNNTTYDNAQGIRAVSGTFILKNNLSYNNVYNDYGGTFSTSSTHNLSFDNSAPAYGTYYRNATVQFIDPANGDFHLSPNDTSAIGKGIDLSDDSYLPFDTDIDGQSRLRQGSGEAQWDIGADEKAGDNVIKGGTRLKGGVRLK